MKKTLIFLLFTFASYCQAQLSINDRSDQQLILTTYEKDGLNISYNFVNNESLSNILDDKHYMGYLYAHFRKNKSILEPIKDVNRVKEAYEQYLNEAKNDTLLVNTLQRISDFSLKPMEEKTTYKFSKILDFATKFIKITGITEKDQYTVRVCSGHTNISDTQEERLADIEAFCFVTILKAFAKKEGPLQTEVYKEFEKIVPLSMGIDRNDRLLRAQGAFFVLMYQNETLRDILKEAYEKDKKILPFRIEY